jgi:predicted kinase
MLKVILTVGIPCSGKSTWSKSEVQKDPTGTVRINRDDLRIMMNNYVYSQDSQ